MEIKFLRLGHSNNSSSAHSIIWVSGNNITNDEIKQLRISSEYLEYDDGFITDDFFVSNEENDNKNHIDFNWNYFLVTTKEVKINYALGQLFFNIKSHINLNNKFSTFKNLIDIDKYKNDVFKLENDLIKNIYIEIIKEHFWSIFFNEFDINNIDNIENFILTNTGHIDHQSIINLPLNRITQTLDINFCKCLFTEFLKNDYILIGGNDNDHLDYETDIKRKQTISFFQSFLKNKSKKNDFVNVWNFLKKYTSIYCLYDDIAKHWILSDKNEGSLIFVSI